MGKLNQNGFAAIEGLLILVIVAIVGGVGFYVYHANQKTNSTLNAASQENSVAAPKVAKKKSSPKTTADPTADWVAYTDKNNKFSLKYPKGWATATHPELCSEGILLIAPTADSVGKCGSEEFGEVSVSSGGHGCFPLDSSYENVTSQSVTVSGRQGTRYTGTAKDNSQMLGAPPAGTKVVLYCFNSSTANYDAEYDQKPGFADVEATFELIVTKTLKFNS